VIERQPEAQPVVREIADAGIDRRNARASIDRAFADKAACVDAEPEEDGRTARPLIEQVTRKVAPAEHRRNEVRRFRDSIVPSPAWTVSARAAARSIAHSARAGSGSCKGRRSLRWRGSLARRFARGDLRHRRNDDLRLGSLDRSSLAANVGRRRASFLLLGLRLLRLLLRRRRGRRWGRLGQVEHAHGAFDARHVHFARQVENHESEPSMDRDHRGDRAAAVTRADVRAISHGSSTPRLRVRCADRFAHEKTPGGGGSHPAPTRTRQLGQRLALLLRPPPWLALPPLLAISRCFAGSIAANPRFDPPLLFVAMFDLPIGRLAISKRRQFPTVHNADSC